MSKLESLKAVLTANPDRAQGEDFKDTQVERDVYRFIKKVRAIAAMPDGELKNYMGAINTEQQKFLLKAFELLKKREVALMMSQKSDDKIEQAWILARMLKEQAEIEGAKKVIETQVNDLKAYYIPKA